MGGSGRQVARVAHTTGRPQADAKQAKTARARSPEAKPVVDPE